MRTDFHSVIERYLAAPSSKLSLSTSTSVAVQQELLKAEPRTAEIEKLISRDQALAAEILKLANSAVYGGVSKISTIRGAIVRIGLNEVCRASFVLAYQNSFSAASPILRIFFQRLWRHSIVCAVISQFVSMRSTIDTDPNVLFFAGLFHDIGKLVVLSAYEQAIRKRQAAISPSELVALMAEFHTAYGPNLLALWNFPELYQYIAQFHHSPLDELHPCPPELEIVMRSDQLAKSLKVEETAVIFSEDYVNSQREMINEFSSAIVPAFSETEFIGLLTELEKMTMVYFN